jgi:hypothetical protein
MVLAFFAVLLVGGALGWTEVPHMVTGQIAFDSLSVANQAKINWMLSGLASAYPRDFLTLATAAVWPDVLKERQLLALSDWHFVDKVYLAPGFTPAQPIRSSGRDDILFAIYSLNHTLTFKPDATDAYTRGFAVSYLSHLLGDIHQPLHCLSRFSTLNPEGDMGGNKMKIVWATSANYTRRSDINELHLLWDSGAAVFADFPAGTDPYSPEGQAYVRAASQRIRAAVPRPALADEQDKYVWADESYSIGVTYAYMNVSDRVNAITVTDDYYGKASEKVRERVALGGYRLATLLERALGLYPSPPPPSATPSVPPSTKPAPASSSATPSPTATPSSQAKPSAARASSPTGLVVVSLMLVTSLLYIGFMHRAAILSLLPARPGAGSSSPHFRSARQDDSGPRSSSGVGGYDDLELVATQSQSQSQQSQLQRSVASPRHTGRPGPASTTLLEQEI